MNKAKVFCVGFHKTGTSSLSNALTKLGYRVRTCGPFVVDFETRNRVCEAAFAEVEKYDAFQDNPWPIIYKELDQKYPGSKFILTTRPTDKWLKSAVRYFGSKDTPMRKWIYGVGDPEGHEEVYVERYERHYREVKEYFQNRPEDLLIISLTEGEGWEKLCSFLDKEIPDFAFPHTNKQENKYQSKITKLKQKIVRKLRSISAN